MKVVSIRFRQMIIGLLAATIASCGGGSSGGLPPPSAPPPPPPPQTFNPSVEFSTSDQTVLSGATFVVGVGTTDLVSPVIEVSCTNGVAAVLDRNLVEFSVPAVSELMESVCTARVSYGNGQTVTDTLSIAILPQTNIGQMVGVFDPPLDLALPNFNLPAEIESYGSHVLTIAESPNLSGMFQVKAIEGGPVSPRQYHRDDIVVIEGDYLSIDFVQSPSLEAHGLPGASLSIASVLENKVYWHIQELQSKVFSVQQTIDVLRPCFIAQTFTYFANDMVVGQVDSGLTVFDIETGSDLSTRDNFDATIIQNIGTGRSLCHIYRGVVPESVTAQYPEFQQSSPSGPAYASPITAIDYNTSELVYYGDIDGDNALEEMGASPIETNSNDQLKVVQVISRGGPTQSPRYLIVLLSDGNHNGEHRVVLINYDNSTHEFSQQILHAWSEGVPVGMLQGQVGGSLEGALFRPDLVVVLGTASKSFFFDNLRPLEDGFGIPPVYGQPTQFEVGLGAGSAVAARSPYPADVSDTHYGVLISYPDTGYVFYVSPTPVE